ncbi:MAG: hypothetical protein ABI693_20280 [Bryobacteraceae bacterium]
MVRIFLLGATLIGLYAVLLCTPHPLFPHAVKANNITLHSDVPLPEPAARHVLELSLRKLERSPLYSSNHGYSVFLCNAPWRQRLLFNKDYGVGGVAPYPISPNVFLRDARIQDNRLIAPSGKPVAGDRTLDYFIAHEITHQLTGQAIGPLRYYQLPQWVREGYADYIGKGDTFHYNEARQAFLDHKPEMDWNRSGLYRRFHLLVAYLLDQQHWSVGRLLANPPSQTAVEAMVVALQ